MTSLLLLALACLSLGVAGLAARFASTLAIWQAVTYRWFMTVAIWAFAFLAFAVILRT